MKYNIYVAGNITLQVLVLMIEYLVAVFWIMDDATRTIFVTLMVFQQKLLLGKVAYVSGERDHHLKSGL